MVQQMLADMAMKTEAARQLVYASARAIDAAEEGTTKMAAMAKCFATDVAMEVATDAVQLFGGYGFMEDYPIEKYLRDAKITPDLRGHQPGPAHGDRAQPHQRDRELEFLDPFIPTADPPSDTS
jgi:hypothetical protein